ncbi:glycine cleavage system protein GcvH [Micromonospora sp. NBC_01405]|uniref:glycine cleavage system protein GcvH n=1 Tax=Micromonospora sp. NBC_01405 TaxID=2903589 RepID=UPI003252A07B
MDVPARLRYSANHEWVDDGVEPASVGITAFAASALGDVVYVELPDPGTHLVAGEVCGEVESTKSVAELYMPVTGRILATNEAVVADPSLIGSDPYGDGWLFRLRVIEPPALMTADEYRTYLTEPH